MSINASKLIEKINSIVAVQGDVVFINFEAFREVNKGVYAIDITGAPDAPIPVDVRVEKENAKQEQKKRK